MIWTFIIISAIYLAAAWISNLVVITLFGFVDIWIKNRNKSHQAFTKLYSASKIVMMLLLIYVNLFLVTLLTKYFYEMSKPPKVQLVFIIPILLGISLLASIKKTSRKTTINEYNQGRFKNDINPLISFEMQKTRDGMIGFGSALGLILFLVYYFFSSTFTTCLKFFFLD